MPSIPYRQSNSNIATFKLHLQGYNKTNFHKCITNMQHWIYWFWNAKTISFYYVRNACLQGCPIAFHLTAYIDLGTWQFSDLCIWISLNFKINMYHKFLVFHAFILCNHHNNLIINNNEKYVHKMIIKQAA